ncbi:MAG TPA: PKD domain-containing protein [Puia sp.]|nr:PKD domain-containing protein [Puia sp.]
MPLSLHVRTSLFREYLLVLSFLAVNGAVMAQLKAGFQPDKSGGCSPLTVSFTNTTTGASPAATYTWDLGNTKVSSLPNPGSTYINEQTYTITLTVQDGAQTSTASQVITVYKKPAVDFSVSPTEGCLPLPVNFSSQSTAGDGTLTNYFWDFADGATQQGAGMGQVTHTYTFAQSASVSLTVTNSYGCYNTRQKQAVVISPAVKAGFTADKVTLCQTTDAVQFTNTSTGGAPLTYNWDFGDGTNSTDKAPSHIFSNKGVYTIKLSVTGAGGCTDISTGTGLIHVADFSTDFIIPGQICQGATAVFRDASIPSASSGVWKFDDGSSDYTYNGAGHHIFSSPGSQTVTLTNTYGVCQQSVSKQVNIVEAPALTGFLVNPLVGCGMPVTVDFSDTTSTAVKWQWGFDPSLPAATSLLQTPSYAYNTEGYYAVRLTVTNAAGCSSTIGKTISIFKPTVFISWFSSTSAKGNASCGDFTIGFSASSDNDPVTSYDWDFGDGGASTDARPLHHFTIPGTYIVHLHYTTRSGCQGVAEYSSVHLYQMPAADFAANPGTTVCGNNPVHFADLSKGPITDWRWDFGDNSNPNTSSSPSWSYTHDGLYTITLIVGNEFCSDTLVKKDYLNVLPPFPRITGAANTCDGTRGLVTFQQKTIKGVSWNWDFGDGSSLPLNTDQTTVAHTYTATGVYNVVLAAINGACTVKDSIALPVLLKQKPLLTADKATICASDALSVQVSGMQLNPLHDFADPNYSYTLKNWQYQDQPSFPGSYAPGGIYYRNNYYAGSIQGLTNGKDSLRAIFLSYGFSCYDTSNYIPLTIKGPVSGYQINTNNVCFHSPVVLQEVAHGNNNVALRTWSWDFGDGQRETQSLGGLVSHYYADPGIYHPVLTVTDTDGCYASSPSYPTYVQVNGPKAAFTYSPTAVSPNTMVYFYNSTNNTGANDTQYQWNFGDGALSNDAYPSHSYSSISTDTVKLIVRSVAAQCADTATQVLYVKMVHTSFQYTVSTINNNSCPPMVVRFADNSVNAARVAWDFGDGSTADNQAYPSHTYYQPGVYKVVLYGYGYDGTRDSTVDLITINGPYATIRADTLSGCRGQTVTLSALVRNASSFTWDFADGTLDQTQDTFAVHQYLTGGLYTPGLILKDGNGCTATSVLNRPIIIDSLDVSIKNKPPHVCDSTLVILAPAVSSVASDQQALQYKWSFGTGVPADTSNAASASFTYRHAGRYLLSLRVTTPYGCSKEITDTLLVVDPQPFRLQIAEEAFACPGLPLLLHAGGAASYNWIHATGLNDNHAADPIAQPPLQAGYTVVGYDPNLCFTDTATLPVHMTPSPTVSAGPDLQVLTGSSFSLHATGSDDVVQWSWSPADGLSCTDCASPVCTPRSSLFYIVTGRTQYGCPASDTLFLKLICDEGRVYIPNSFTPNGDGKNERWYIKGKGIRVINYLRIFNRWGEIIFQRGNFNIDDASSGWDGTFKGNPVETGTYVYLAEMVCDNGEVFPVKGSFMVIR